MSLQQPEHGDRFVWMDSVVIEVLAISKSGDYAQVLCYDGISVWRKRQPLPFPDSFRELAPL